MLLEYSEICITKLYNIFYIEKRKRENEKTPPNPNLYSFYSINESAPK